MSYSVGVVDDRFGKTREQLVLEVNKAADIWNVVYKTPLFAYSETGSLDINFVYDRRQSLQNDIVDLEGKLSDQKGSLEEKVADYQGQVKELDTKKIKLDSDISYWNSRGGAPEDEFNRLNAEIAAYNAEVERLASVAKSLNISAKEFNSQVGNLNQTIGKFNRELSTRPEEGLFISDDGENRIEIYFVSDPEELVHTLAHELGHARGLMHNDNPNSLMYSNSSQFLQPSPEDISDLNTICAEKNIVDNLRERFATVK